MQALGWSVKDACAFALAIFATGAILINVLFLQSGPHPAPMFKSVAQATPVQTVAAAAAPTAAPRTRSIGVAPVPAPAPVRAEPPATVRMPGDVIADIQKELTRRGFYDGTVDGLYGPKTDAAIRDFEQAAGLKPSADPNENLLRTIAKSGVKAVKATTAAAVRPPAPVHSDPIAERIGYSKRVLAVQRALAEYGYGQIKPTGVVDHETQSAIEKFERQRKLPVTGQVSDRVARELAAITGRPLE